MMTPEEIQRRMQEAHRQSVNFYGQPPHPPPYAFSIPRPYPPRPMGAEHSPPAPPPPPGPEDRQRIDKMAEYVARNGVAFEGMLREKERNNPKFAFLFGGEHALYYRWKLQQMSPSAMAPPAQGYPAVPYPTPNYVVPRPAYPLPVAYPQAEVTPAPRRPEPVTESMPPQLPPGAALTAEEVQSFDEMVESLNGSNSSIRDANSWVLKHSNKVRDVLWRLKKKTLELESTEKKLFILYLVNDLLFSCTVGEKELSGANLKAAIVQELPEMIYGTCFSKDPRASPPIDRVEKMLRLWKEHQVFSPGQIKDLEMALARECAQVTRAVPGGQIQPAVPQAPTMAQNALGGAGLLDTPPTMHPQFSMPVVGASGHPPHPYTAPPPRHHQLPPQTQAPPHPPPVYDGQGRMWHQNQEAGPTQTQHQVDQRGSAFQPVVVPRPPAPYSANHPLGDLSAAHSIPAQPPLNGLSPMPGPHGSSQIPRPPQPTQIPPNTAAELPGSSPAIQSLSQTPSPSASRGRWAEVPALPVSSSGGAPLSDAAAMAAAAMLAAQKASNSVTPPLTGAKPSSIAPVAVKLKVDEYSPGLLVNIVKAALINGHPPYAPFPAEFMPSTLTALSMEPGRLEARVNEFYQKVKALSEKPPPIVKEREEKKEEPSRSRKRYSERPEYREDRDKYEKRRRRDSDERY